MKKIIASLAVVGVSAVSFAGSASAIPAIATGTVPTLCEIQSATSGILGPNRINPNELSTNPHSALHEK